MRQVARFRLWLVAMLLLLTFFGLHTVPSLKVDSNLLAMLPVQQRDPGAERASRRVSDGFARRLLFLVGAEEYPLARTAAAELATNLRASSAFDSVQFEPDAAALRPSDAEHAARFGLIAAPDRARLAAGAAEALRDEALRALYSPAGFARLTAVVDDPLGLFDHQLARHCQHLAARLSKAAFWPSVMGARSGCWYWPRLATARSRKRSRNLWRRLCGRRASLLRRAAPKCW